MVIPAGVTHSRALENPRKGTTFKALVTSGVGRLSRLLIVFFAATVSLALRAIALAQQIHRTRAKDQGCDQYDRVENQHEKKDNTFL
jgi:hypothetical protein